MTPLLFLGPAAFALVILLATRIADDTRLRVIRAAGGVGVLLAVLVVLDRGDIERWRTTSLDGGPAAVAGVACACAWGLSLALDLDRERWWPTALTGVGASALLLFTATVWLAPALLFWMTMSCALAIAASRAARSTWAVLALGDIGVVGALVLSHRFEGGEWLFPDAISGIAVVPLAIGLVVRAGAVPGLGSFASLGSPGAALVPLWVGGAFVLLLRVIERPAPVAGAAALAVALAVAGWSMVGRRLHPRLLAAWPVSVGLALCLLSQRAGPAAAVAAVLGVTGIVLWPDSLGRGRMSRGFLLSGALPNVIFGAVATAASESFVQATRNATGAVEMGAWLAAAALLPVVLGAGLALGAMTARSGVGADYHPEAVFMTWLVLAASVIAGVVLGAGGVYAALGGERAPVVIAAALGLGILVARVRAGRGAERAPIASTSGAADVTVTEPRLLPAYAGAAALLSQIACGAVAAWLTIEGLQVGFL